MAAAATAASIPVAATGIPHSIPTTSVVAGVVARAPPCRTGACGLDAVHDHVPAGSVEGLSAQVSTVELVGRQPRSGDGVDTGAGTDDRQDGGKPDALAQHWAGLFDHHPDRGVAK